MEKDKANEGGGHLAHGGGARPGNQAEGHIAHGKDAAHGAEADSHIASSREVAKGSMWGLAGTITLKLVSFAYVIYVARAFSQGDIGLFYLALSVITLLAIWRDFGLPAALSRYVAFYDGKNEGKKAKDLLRITVLVNLATGVFVAIAFWFLADFISAFYANPGLADALRLLSAYSLIYGLFSIATTYLQGRMDIPASQLVNNVQNLSKLIFVVALFSIYGASLFTLCASFLLSYLMALLVSLPLVKRKISDLPDGKGGLATDEIWREIIPFGIMLTILQSFLVLISSVDKAMLGYFGAPAGATEAVAVYSLATQLALTLTVFPGAIATIFLPTISRLVGREDFAGVRSVLQTSQRWMLFITLPVAVVMIAFSSELLYGFYGSSYQVGAAALSIFVFGLVFNVMCYAVALALAGMRLVRIELKVAFIAGLINVALNVILIPQFGMVGASIASAVGFFATAVLFNHYGEKFLKFRMPPETYRLLAAGLATLLLALLLKPVASFATGALPAIGDGETQHYAEKAAYMLFVGILTAVSVAIFAVLALLAKTFKQEDISLMKSAARKVRAPEQLILLAEKIASYGVAPEKK